MTEEDKRKIINHLLSNGRLKEEFYIQHHKTSNVFIHSVRVGRLSLKIAKFLHLKISERDLLIGSLLHDYFLYNWHDKNSHSGLHGYTHSKVAADNAKLDYNVNKKIYNMIYSHMFPLNITHIPKSKEAWILTIADKIVAIKEQLHLQ